MTELESIATYTAAHSTTAIELVINGRTLALTQVQVAGRTEAEMTTAIQGLATVGGVSLPPMWIHRNRNGSIAIATGREPAVWPEDRNYD